MFEKWCQTYQVPKTIGREVKSYLKWAWDVATEKEQGRIITVIGEVLKEMAFEDEKADIGWWDVKRHLAAAIREATE